MLHDRSAFCDRDSTGCASYVCGRRPAAPTAAATTARTTDEEDNSASHLTVPFFGSAGRNAVFADVSMCVWLLTRVEPTVTAAHRDL